MAKKETAVNEEPQVQEEATPMRRGPDPVDHHPCAGGGLGDGVKPAEVEMGE